VGMDDVEAITGKAPVPSRSPAEQTAQVDGGAPQRAAPGSELIELDLQLVQAPQRGDLIAHEAAALGMGGVREHVGDHEGAHHPPTVALWNDGVHGQRIRWIGPTRTADRRVRLGRGRAHRPARAAGTACRARTSCISGTPRGFPTATLTRGIERFAAEIAEELLRRRAKLLVVACNSVASSALPSLTARMQQTTLGLDVLGVVRPEAIRAVAATRSGRIGLLATPTTVASGAYERAVAAVDPHVTLHAVPCPTLASIIQAGDQFDEQAVAAVREVCEPLKAAGVDTVILGCTHYPLISPLLQRMLGPEVTLVSSGAALARQVEHALSTRALENPRTDGEGDYMFLCTGDVDAFRELGTRFLQMPLGTVERVELAAVEALA